MKQVFSLLLLLLMKSSFAQGQNEYRDIDWKVQFIDAKTPDSLAKKLTEFCTNDLQRTRAIFSWIAQHISYNTYIFNTSKRIAAKYIPEPEDTSFDWKSGTEMTARKILKKRTAVCDGYAKLFKTLCDYAGLQSEIIIGYAKCYMENGEKFRTNHTWNAVKIDSNWHLVDVTWASGYINYADQYVQRLKEDYFLTPPDIFIQDHYPEDLQWTLMDNPPALKEFQKTPFKYKSFVKYSIASFQPSNGVINAAIGDTLQIELKVADIEKDKKISNDPFFDSTIFSRSPFSSFLSPSEVSNKRVVYTYVINSATTEWLHIMYNDDVIMRYHLNVREEQRKETGRKVISVF